MKKQSQESQSKSHIKMDQESEGFTNLSKRILEASSKGHIMLSDEQKTVLEAVSRVQSIFVTGSAGIGKS